MEHELRSDIIDDRSVLAELEIAYIDFDKYTKEKICQIENGEEVFLIETPHLYSELGIIIGYYKDHHRLGFIDYDYAGGCDVYAGPQGSRANDEITSPAIAIQILKDYFSTQD